MIERDTILRNLSTSGRINEDSILVKVDEAINKGNTNPMNGIPKTVSIKSNTKIESINILSWLQAFYEEPSDICFLEMDRNGRSLLNDRIAIDAKLYAAMKAILKIGVTPNAELSNACKNIFQKLLTDAYTVMSLSDRLKRLPAKELYEKDIVKALESLWGC